MTKNIGPIDRAARIIVGLALVAFALFSGHEYSVWGWIGVVPFVTAVIRWCPAYAPFGIKTG